RRLLNSIPESRYALEKLEAAKNTEKNMQDLLAMRNNQAELSKQMELQDKGVSYKIIDPAVTPVTPVSPNRRKLLLMSISAGLAGAAGVLFLIDQLDTSVKLIDNLKPLGLPILAVIPLIKSEEEICSARERDLKIYAVSSMYFSLILMVVVLELISSSIFETAVYRMHLPQIFARFFK
ncbi:MAG: chain-length determining protein, partial [Geobacteraceae bacterium]|nr:chain-length determining protein [Geobacteraceae bacterium]